MSEFIRLTLILAGMFWLGVVMGYLLGISVAEGFEMTPELENETMLMPYCRNLNEVWVPVLNTTCSFFYGGPVD